MHKLTRFIDYHYKSIVSIIRVGHVLTLHLSTANWRKLSSCCKKAPAHYVILPDRVIPEFLELEPCFNAFRWSSNFTLLYRNYHVWYQFHFQVFLQRWYHACICTLNSQAFDVVWCCFMGFCLSSNYYCRKVCKKVMW